MRKNIIQSKTEPNKNDIWLSEEGLKKYGKDGWEPLGSRGINDSTPAFNEVYIVNLENYSADTFKELTQAIQNNKIIVFNDGVVGTMVTPYAMNDFRISAIITICVPSIPHGADIEKIDIEYVAIDFNSDGSINPHGNGYSIEFAGDGTKFLSDDGTYKEVSGGSGPVIIEIDYYTASPTSVTDEQINAAKNGNIKIKAVSQEENSIVFMIPTNYIIKNDYITLDVVNAQNNGSSYGLQLEIDIINKTIKPLVN